MCMRKILYVILSLCLMAVSVADLSAQEDRLTKFNFKYFIFITYFI